MKSTLSVAIIMLAISIFPVFAQTNPITVQTDDNNYDEGDIVVISGKVTTVVQGTPAVLQIFFEGNMIDIAQITVAQDGSYTHTIIAEGPLWNKSGEYLVRASFGEGNIAESEFSFTKKTEAIITNDTFEVKAGNAGTFDVNYTIKGGTVKDMEVNSNNFSVVIQIETSDDGSITLSLPREFIGAEKQDGKDEAYIVLIDDVETGYKETTTNSDLRTLTIEFQEEDSRIEVIGTYVIPEFTGILIMMVFLIGMIITVVSTSNKLQTM